MYARENLVSDGLPPAEPHHHASQESEPHAMDESSGAPQEYTAEEWAAWHAEQAQPAAMSPPCPSAPPPTSLLLMAAPPASHVVARGIAAAAPAWFHCWPHKGLALMTLRCLRFEVSSSRRNLPCRGRRHS